MNSRADFQPALFSSFGDLTDWRRCVMVLFVAMRPWRGGSFAESLITVSVTEVAGGDGSWSW